jgi:hypothetical protein
MSRFRDVQDPQDETDRNVHPSRGRLGGVGESAAADAQRLDVRLPGEVA